jgi:choice-of-anchor A domain-containing protein
VRETRGLRTRAYVERAAGRVSERSDSDAEGTYGVREVWSQAGTAASDQTAQEVGDAVLARAAIPQESIDAGVGPSPHMPYREFAPGDVVALEGRDGMRDPRVSAVTVELADQVDVDVTLESRAELVERDLQRFLEGMSDATMAASSNLQRRLREVRADLIIAGALRVDTDIKSSDWDASAGTGWKISGAGNIIANDGTFRGEVDAQSGQISGDLTVGGSLEASYSAGSSGWHIDGNGSAEFNNVTVRGQVDAQSGQISGDLAVGGSLEASYSAGSSGWHIDGNGSAEFNNVTVRGQVDAQSGQISGDLAVGGSLSGSSWVLDSNGFRTSSGGDRIELSDDNVQEVAFYNNGNKVALLGTDGVITAFDSHDLTTIKSGVSQGRVSLQSFNGVYVRNGDDTGWQDIHASTFIVESSRQNKSNVRIFEIGDEVSRTPVRRFVDGLGNERVGWMADEAPPAARRKFADRSGNEHDQVSLPDMVALLWAEVQSINDRMAHDERGY